MNMPNQLFLHGTMFTSELFCSNGMYCEFVKPYNVSNFKLVVIIA